MPSLFKRKTEPAATEPDGADDTPPVEAGARPKAYTEKKGRPTPKRKDAQKRSAEAPPADRKEAARRLRERQRVERSEARQKMMAGDERYLPARDRGPERALVRDVVDSRRNVGSYFLIAALVILIGTSQGMPPVVRLVTQFLWYALAVIFIADCVLVCRRVRKTVKTKYPKSQVRFGGLYWYAIMRSITFRKLRMPNPKVKIGERP